MAAPWEKYNANNSQLAQLVSNPSPWDKYGTKTQAIETPEQVDARVNAKYKGMSLWDRTIADAKGIGQSLTPVFRGSIDAVNSLPVMAQDLGVGIRNLFPGQNYQLPSQMYEEQLNKSVPMPDIPGAKALRLGTSLIAGSLIPSPTKLAPSTQLAPEGFKTAKETADAARNARLSTYADQGFTVPPATANSNPLTRTLESFGGKAATAQQASAMNVQKTNELARKALEVPDGTILDPETLNIVRKNAGEAYNAVRNVGTITPDSAYFSTLDKINAASQGAGKSFPNLATSEIGDAVNSVKVPKFDSSSAIDAISIMRDKADQAYVAGNKSLGGAYKKIAGALEDQIGRHLESQMSQAGPSQRAALEDIVGNFQNARQIIAKSYSVQKAASQAGDVSAYSLGQQLAKGKPLSGGLLDAARFGSNFPAAAKIPAGSVGVNNLDMTLSAGAAGLSGHPGYLGYPLAMAGARKFILSPLGQSFLNGASNSSIGSFGSALNPMALPALYQGLNR